MCYRNKEEEIHRLVRDFEEEQSEKENQIHHLKATATNTIRNLYALNGLTGENISNNIEAQQLKRSISGKTLDLKSKDPKKKVSFGLERSRLASTLSRPGERGDINETIDLSRSQKLLSPYRKRTTAYTQATKSAMKTRGRDTSTKKDRDAMLTPLGPSTPGKFTHGKRSTIGDDFDRDDNSQDLDRSMYGIPTTIGQIESNSALVMQLKNLLQNALDREKHLADFIEKLCNHDLAFLSKKFENLKIADVKIRENTERLLMRNEELETRLLDAQSKLWTLKLMYEEYDHVINEMAIQKEENQYIHKENKGEVVGAIKDFFSAHGLSYKKGKSSKSRSVIGSQKSRKTLRKKQSVRFQNSFGRSRGGDEFSDAAQPKSRTALLRRMGSRGSKVSLRKSRSEAVRLPEMQTEPREETKSHHSRSKRSNIQAQRSSSIQPSIRQQRSIGGRSIGSRSRGGVSQGIQPSNRGYQDNEGMQTHPYDQQDEGIQLSFGGRQVNEGIQPSRFDQRSASVQPSFDGRRQDEGLQPDFVDQRSAAIQLSVDRRSQESIHRDSDPRSAHIQLSHGGRRSTEGMQDDPRDPRSGEQIPTISGRRSPGNVEELKDQRMREMHPQRSRYEGEGSQENPGGYRGSDPHFSDRRSSGNIQDEFMDEGTGRIHPQRSRYEGEGSQEHIHGPGSGIQHFSDGHMSDGNQQEYLDNRRGQVDPSTGGIRSRGGQEHMHGPGSGIQHFSDGHMSDGNQQEYLDNRRGQIDPSTGNLRSRGGQIDNRSRGTRGQIISGEMTPQNPQLPHLESRGASQRSVEFQSNRDGVIHPRGSQGFSPDNRSRGNRGIASPIHSRGGRPGQIHTTGDDRRGYDPMDYPDDGLDDIHEEYTDDEGEYDEGEEDESDDDENIDAKSIFDDAHNYIEDLKDQIQEHEDAIENNEQNIDSLSNELEELKKINDRLETQLYKYQYDINRVTDILVNESHPIVKELEQEETEVEDMTDQERHLYVLLKKAAELREHQTDSSRKLEVYEKDIEELMQKNKHLQEIEELKQQMSSKLDNEKQRIIELESIIDEKQHAFSSIMEEKEALLENLNKIQAEKDELKGTLDTLHQLRDQEEEEIEKTLDEAKSIIQKLEEKLHTKDEKIKKYKEKLSNNEIDKSQLEKQILNIEEDFKDKEKNMKLKLLWAQMEKKDLATTILKLENSTHNIHQSEVKVREHSH